MKECFRCEKKLSLDDFYKHPQMADGHVNKCKTCNKNDVSLNYRKNIDYYKDYEKSRANLPHRIEAREIYQEENSEKYQEYKNKWARNNPEKRKAHHKVSNCIRDGKIVKQSCEVCEDKNSQAHHYDYSKPLDVQWLCSKHHAKHHVELREKIKKWQVK